MEAEGKRIVGEVASSWSQKYIFMIRHGGFNEGLWHYECLFSRPTNSQPVPKTMIAVLFAFLPPSAGQAPRLFYSFEEGDLRHEWSLTQSSGRWHAAKGQQQHSLRHGSFDGYLDAYIREKETVRSRGTNVSTTFEVSRLTPPPACSYDDDDAGSQSAAGRSFSRLSASGDIAELEVSFRPQSSDGNSQDMARAMTEALKAANMYCDKVAPPSSLHDLLANIFDAADEEGFGQMPHYEVARVMRATLPGFALEEWDINILLGFAEENDDGFIELKRFIKQAPELVMQLREHRMAYREKGITDVEIPSEALKHCYTEELMVIVDQLIHAFEHCAAEDPNRGAFVTDASMGRRGSNIMGSRASLAHSGSEMGMGGGDPDMMSPHGGDDATKLIALKRRYCLECIQRVPERISPQEGQMLLQMLPEDENGFLNFEDLTERLEQLREQALLNAVVACDLRALRIHLVTRCRALGLDWTGKLKVWTMKHALLSANQVCLSRLQIHTLLCLTDPDDNGDCDVSQFLLVCAAIIPHMSNARIFVEIAERLMLEHAEAAKERANAELAALGAARVTTQESGEEEQAKEKVEVDQETVERNLIQALSLIDDTRKPTPALPPEAIFNLLWNSSDQQVQSCNLDEYELAGLVAEMPLDANGDVPYHEFVKRWVPIMFELRKNPLLGGYLRAGAADTLGIPEPDADALEAIYPLLPEGMVRPPSVEQPEQRQGSKTVIRSGSKVSSRRSLSKRPSTEATDDDCYLDMLRDPSKPSAAAGRMATPGAAKEPPPGRGYQRRKMHFEKYGLAPPPPKG